MITTMCNGLTCEECKSERGVTECPLTHYEKENEQMEKTETEFPQSQTKIAEVCDKIKEILLYKNQMYGDSALNPEPIFYKGSAQDSILVRLNDKISRIKNNRSKPRINDISDLIGYCVLLLVSMGTTAEDFDKLKD